MAEYSEGVLDADIYSKVIRILESTETSGEDIAIVWNYLKDFIKENYLQINNALHGDEAACENLKYRFDNSKPLTVLGFGIVLFIYASILGGAINGINAPGLIKLGKSLGGTSLVSVKVDQSRGSVDVYGLADVDQVWRIGYEEGLEEKFLPERVYMDNVDVESAKEEDIPKYKITFTINNKEVSFVVPGQIRDINDLERVVNEALQRSGVNLQTFIYRKPDTNFYPERILFILVEPITINPQLVLLGFEKYPGYGGEDDQINIIGEENPVPYNMVFFVDSDGTTIPDRSYPVGIKIP